MSDNQLLRASSVMAVGTIASRVTGLIRNLLLVALLGQIANAKGRFGPMMWAPVINNLIAILLFSWFLVNRRDIKAAP